MPEAWIKAASIDQSPLKGEARRKWELEIIGLVTAMSEGGATRSRTRAWNHTLLALLDFAQGKADCFPSKAAIAERLGVDPKTVARNLKAMAEAGLVLQL